MDAAAVNPMLTPIVQYGFAGLCAILLAMLTWAFATLFTLQRETIKQVSANTDVVRSVTHQIERLATQQSDIRDRLLGRPCIADFLKTGREDAT